MILTDRYKVFFSCTDTMDDVLYAAHISAYNVCVLNLQTKLQRDIIKIYAMRIIVT